MNKTGFGFLRLPRTPDKGIDYAALNPIVDEYLALGGRYFDTAYTYLGGLSEEAIRKSLVERHPRESFLLADKLPGYNCKSYEDCFTFFREQLRRCGVSYFDVFMLHWLNADNYRTAEKFDEFRFLQEIKRDGLAGKIGFSFHDSPELLDEILTAHPETDCVLLQINYLDWNSVSLRARECYETAVRHGKEVIVMEPVKGGSLASLPADAEAMLRAMRPEDSIPSWAIRFAADLPNVSVVLSGMNTLEQVRDNLRPLAPLAADERSALEQCAAIIRSSTAVQCTGCGYCAPHCPMSVPIPHLFALYNDYARNPGDDWKMQHAYDSLPVRASACIACRKCEQKCPQHIAIADMLKPVKKAFEP